ncbi:MAG: hypothetical protein AAGA54_18885 [Myxococcota bacterium]
MTRTTFGLAASFLLLACEPSAPTSAPDDAAPAEPAAPSEILPLGDATLFETARPDDVIAISANGEVRLGGEVIVTLSSDGAVTTPDGAVVMQVQEDDSILARGEPSGLFLTETGGRMEMGGQVATVAFNADGSLSVEPPPAPGAPEMGHSGCVGPMVRACTVVLLGTVGMVEESYSEVELPASAESEPAMAPEPAPPE